MSTQLEIGENGDNSMVSTPWEALIEECMFKGNWNGMDPRIEELFRPKDYYFGMKAQTGTFVEEWWDHQTDGALYVLFRCLQAPYAFLDHCQAILESRISAAFSNFFLIRRGSAQRGVALKGTADLDLDLILPRSFARAEDWRPTSEDGMAEFEIWKQFCFGIADRIAGNDFAQAYDSVEFKESIRVRGLTETVESQESSSSAGPYVPIAIPRNIGTELVVKYGAISRSIPGSIGIHGIQVELDIFPKLVDKDGNICCFGSKEIIDGKTSRPWNQQQINVFRKTVVFKDAEAAAILLVKLWKAKYVDTNSQSAEKVKHVLDCIKGYHMALVMEWLINHCQERGDRDQFTVLVVTKLLCDMVNTMIKAYGDFETLHGEGIETLRVLSTDTPSDYRAQVVELLRKLLKDTNQKPVEGTIMRKRPYLRRPASSQEIGDVPSKKPATMAHLEDE